MDRRTFITLITALLATRPDRIVSAQTHQTSSEALKDPWSTLSAVMEHLFPASENTPGASDILAIQFLQNMLNTPDADEDEKQFILNGANWLNDMASKHHKQRFVELNAQAKESILRQIEQSNAGERWLSLMLTYLIEALLSDPVYGGNPEGSGWQWLQHQPGFPRPTVDKVYYRLGKTTYTRTKS